MQAKSIINSLILNTSEVIRETLTCKNASHNCTHTSQKMHKRSAHKNTTIFIIPHIQVKKSYI